MNIQHLLSKNNLPTVLVDGYLLHSKYNPLRESEAYYKEKYNSSSQITILFGVGLGYFVLEVLKHQDNLNNIVIIDPLYEELCPDILNNQEIITNITGENIHSVLHGKIGVYDKNFNVICSPNYDKLFPKEYKILLESIKNIQMTNLVNYNTVNRYSQDWQQNNIRNIYNLIHSSSLKDLYKKYKLPVIIVSGGPSLNKQLNDLKKYEHQFLIIAAGSTINTLITNNISPDYVVSIDGGIHNYNHFKDLEVQNLNLIYSLNNHFKIAEKPFKSKYAFITNNEIQIQKYLKKYYDVEIPLLTSGSSVAVLALYIASYISSGPIALIGQDLAYTDLKTHAEGNKGFSLVDDAYIEEKGLFKIEGYFPGEEVYTDYVFLTMKQDMEKIGEYLGGDFKLYNCTEGGLNINNFINNSFKNFLEGYAQKETKNICINLNANTLNSEDILKKLIKEKSIYYKLIKKLSQIIDLLVKSRNNRNFSQSLLKKLDAIDKELNYLEDTLVYNILNPLIITVLSDTGEKNNNETEFDAVLKKNLFFYSELLKAVKFSLEEVNNLIEDLKGEF